MNFKHCFFAAAASILFISCGGATTPSGTVDSLSSPEEMEEYYEEQYAQMTDGQLYQLIITSIVNGDKKTFADLVNYPLCRDYPLRNIENRQQMTAYFDTLFDRSFRDRVRNLDSTDWCPVGWRGSMLLDGEIWFSEGVTAVNYSSPVEQAHRAKLIKAEIKSLHPSLQGNWEPVDRMKFSQGPYGFARVDANGDRYRLTLFAPDARVGDKPLINWEGELLVEGTARVETYTFQGPEGSAVYSPTSMESGQPEFELTLKGQEPLELPCTACYYQPVKL